VIRAFAGADSPAQRNNGPATAGAGHRLLRHRLAPRRADCGPCSPPSWTPCCWFHLPPVYPCGRLRKPGDEEADVTGATSPLLADGLLWRPARPTTARAFHADGHVCLPGGRVVWRSRGLPGDEAICSCRCRPKATG
jgi:hypothetical protein